MAPSQIIIIGLIVLTVGMMAAQPTAAMRTKFSGNTVSDLAKGSPLVTVAHSHEEQIMCPPLGFDSVAELNVTEYARAPWYIYSQMPITYQKADTLFCVRVSYEVIDDDTLRVRNYGNKDEVNGPASGTSGAANSTLELIAKIKDASEPSKLLVGPSFLPAVKPLFGDYWVAALGVTSEKNSSAEQYEWAVVTAGPPFNVGKDMKTCYNGCNFPRGCDGHVFGAGEGFWIFVRDPLPSYRVVEAAYKAARNLKLDLSKLVNVPQDGCKYIGA